MTKIDECTTANMDVVLEEACQGLPHGGDHESRKYVAKKLMQSVKRIDAEVLLAQAGIDAKEREAADKLQKLILEELHHRIKNTLATVSAIASQSLIRLRASNTANTLLQDGWSR